jgi:hypothetical protein
MLKQIASTLILMSITSAASAGTGGNVLCDYFHLFCPPQNKHEPVKAPEIDPSAAIAAMTLLGGGLAVMRGRRVKNSAK